MSSSSELLLAYARLALTALMAATAAIVAILLTDDLYEVPISIHPSINFIGDRVTFPDVRN